MAKKVQLPVIGGVRKTITIPDQQASSGTTIAGLAGQTITIAQLAGLLGVQQQKPNTQGGGSGTQAALILGPGLAGGGSLVGAVPLNLIAPIPAFVFEEGGGGGDGDPGPPGLPGQPGPTGAPGPNGPAVFLAAEDGEDAFPIPGRAGIDGSSGATGAPGPVGPAAYMSADDGEDGWHAIPGPASTVVGPAGSNGAPGPAIYMLADDGNDGEPGAPGPTGASGTGGGGLPSGTPLIVGYEPLTAETGWTSFSAVTKIPAKGLVNVASSWKFGISVLVAGLIVSKAVVRRTLRNNSTYIDSTTITWGGSGTPTFAAGYTISDVINVTIDVNHDTYIIIFFSASTPGTAALATGNPVNEASALQGTEVGGDITGSATAPITSTSSGKGVFGVWTP